MALAAKGAPALRWPQPNRRLAAETLAAGMPFALRPLARPSRRTVADRWRPALVAALIGLAVLVGAFGWEVRRGIAERATLRADQAATEASAAAIEAELQAALTEASRVSAQQREAIGRQRDQIGQLGAGLAARTQQADGLERALAAEREALWAQRARTASAEGEAADQRRQVGERQAERDALAEQLSQREAELAQLNERLDALQQRIVEMEALARKVRQTLGLPAAAGPVGGDLPAADEAALMERLAALDARGAAASEALAGAEKALRERLAALRQLATAGQAIRLSPAAAAVAPTGWPAPGPISSQFGPRISPIDQELRFHAGVDIAVPVGTPVKATQAGDVVQAGMSEGYGLAVVVRHEGGFETLYAHNSVARARVGQRVERGEVIAYAGNTGSSTGPHLHYEVRYQGRPIDPEPMLRAGGR